MTVTYSGDVQVGGPADVRELPGLVLSKIAVGPMSNNAYLLRCRETGEEKCILFNFSGHGLCDLGSYDKYLRRELDDYEYPQERIEAALAELPAIE